MTRVQKTLIVVVGAIGFSVLGIQASDMLQGVNTQLSGLVVESDGPCPIGEVQHLFGSHAVCVDQYEAAPSASCVHSNVSNQLQTQDNLNVLDCTPVSQAGVQPWRFVSLTQAQQLCARSQKRLPTSEEWYKISLSMGSQDACVVTDRTSPALTGSAPTCTTAAGVYDMVGNVWEWVDAEVRDGVYDNRPLPPSGYISLVDTNGVVLETSQSAQAAFGDDYAWTKDTGVYGVIRGGFYGSETDAGIFTQNLSVPLDFRTAGVGFRCVRDL